MHFDDYFELSEKHSWRASQLDWEELRRDQDADRVSEFDREALCGTAVIEHGVPHYGEVWTLVEDLRKHWELWQFTSLWTGEEQRHSYALQRATHLLGCSDRIDEDLRQVRQARFADTQKKSCPTDCYRSVPGMLTYAIIQELATHKFYGLAAKRSKSPFLKQLFTLIAGDEMRHHVFFREALAEIFATVADREGYTEQVFLAARSFKMPHLIYNVQVPFFEDGDWSIGTLGKIAFKAQLARCFSFDARLLGRLISEKADSTLHASGGRAPVVVG